ncbi:DNA-binding transcriptional regulator, AcrR family [Leifsonia sp. 98AMF]|uniref:TetR/AcrR family transcriptional regulator n=1 Tax=Microbacteriaceae TaxID=85023 RepID=UPI00037159C9|nr:MULTISPECIES: TetR/AcrR family transcriptional regulator [Microbacteriaceae]SDH28714.1 DNA-binding transcriptional regulator, AcrR family [Leifsonia sp. 197AMF]SDJ09379.1 DNA-binding transcriptional regulator, AcrR family [Leifsonia sp. 466MF]SDJ61312.1 DNA-binding transcriptional regulator, AcrR family [Leifsonia sp. 157MF]SDN30552.1 DNA-binding transcriptional regulator, AcrR family [Leifsonia sp. 509MF]SEM90647.1 DNA-binding transcriptional regulator, AcrR family [Leifsonia sp. 467MF]
MDSTTLSEGVTTGVPEDIPAESARRQRTRARLLDAAFDVFAEQGVRAASVETIAEAAGFTRGAFYSNFSSKEELFFALMEREKTMRLEQLNTGVAQFLAPLVGAGGAGLSDEDVLQTITHILELQSDDRRWWLVQAEFQLMALRDHAIAADYLRYHDEFFADLTEIVVEALASARRRFTIAPEEAVRVIAELCASGEARAVLAGDERTFTERLSESVPAILLALTERV